MWLGDIYYPMVQFSDLYWITDAYKELSEEEFNSLMIKWIRDKDPSARLRLMFCSTDQSLTNFKM